MVEETHAGNWYVLVFGLPRPEATMVLASGISLRPLDARLDVFDLAAVGAVGFREWAALEPIIPYCTCEIESAKDADFPPGFDTLNRAWLASALLVLRGSTLASGVACSAYSWNSVPVPGASNAWDGPSKPPESRRARTNLLPFRGGLLDLHLRTLHDRGMRRDPLTVDDAEWIRTHFDTFNRLAADSESFYFALHAAIDWRYATGERSAVARLWSGIEAMFDISSELVFRIALLAASLLEPRGEARKARFQEVKKLYGLRSKAVHGSALTDDLLQAAMSDSYHLLRDLILLVIEKGHMLTTIDFDCALFE
jgi:hypothetical protein